GLEGRESRVIGLLCLRLLPALLQIHHLFYLLERGSLVHCSQHHPHGRVGSRPLCRRSDRALRCFDDISHVFPQYSMRTLGIAPFVISVTACFAQSSGMPPPMNACKAVRLTWARCSRSASLRRCSAS